MKNNKKLLTRFIAIFAALVMLLSGVTVNANSYLSGDSTGPSDVPDSPFVFWKGGNNGAGVSTRGLYNFDRTIRGQDLGIDSFSSLMDISVDKNDNVYLLDGTASKIYILDKDYNLINTISSVSYEGENYEFAGASGVFVNVDDKIYISDTENARVIVCDTNGVGIQMIYLPDSPLIPSEFNFRPLKVAVDSSDYVYVLSDGSYYGAILYSPKGEFLGFFGANSVATSITQSLLKLWKNLTMTNEKRRKSESKIPFQFNDLFADHADFIYTATGSTSGWGVSDKGQIKRLSPGGLNTLDEVFFGVPSGSAGGDKGNIVSVVADDDDFIYSVTVDGKVLIYDNECQMISAFGGEDNSGAGLVGAFQNVTALDIKSDRTILVLDNTKLDVTVYDLNDYGKLIFEADTLEIDGDYDAACELWNEVLKQNSNCQVAYSGIAKSYLQHQDYANAMKYSKFAFNKETYSLAFQYVRRDFLDKNLNWMFIVLVLLIVALFIFKKYKNKKGITFIKNTEFKLLSRVMLHPNDVFTDMKEKNLGSVKIGTALIIIYYITATLKNTLGGFLFVNSYSANLNSLLVLVQTLGAVLLWTIVNWAVCTLLDGKGKLREIYIVISYALVPLILSNICYIILSNCLTTNEGTFINILSTVFILFAAYILISGTLVIHDYSFGKFVWTSFLTIIGMLIALFVMITVFILVQQMGAFLITLFREIVYR